MDKLSSALQAIPCAGCDYGQWIGVGMALKYAGHDCSEWEEWSRADSRYHQGECEAKWRGFNGSSSPITEATIYRMAMDYGWEPPMEGYILDWDGVYTEVGKPEIKEDPKMLRQYLEAVFHPDDIVGYVSSDLITDAEGNRHPGRGTYYKTAGQMIQEIDNCNGDITKVIESYDLFKGAWIRFNALDGKGVKNENVVSYRHALVESDTMSIQQQEEAYRQLNLPITAMVYSGGKSLHAIVRVDATDWKQYAERVDFLYAECAKAGIIVDRQNKNPSRLSRMPGVVRDGKLQKLVGLHTGAASWEDWKTWLAERDDTTPPIRNLLDLHEEGTHLAPPLIDGLLRQGHKMGLTGPSKAGKSFALIQLCASFAEGLNWIDWPCKQCKVLYINMEIDPESVKDRFWKVYQALGVEPSKAHLGNIYVWNLRGVTLSMEDLATKAIAKCKKLDVQVIILDPIYKVMLGDENSAGDVGKFCVQMDRICAATGASFIYCHHHSKGAQGGKNAMDRGSGSGVFARDPDALVDVVPLDMAEEQLQMIQGRYYKARPYQMDVNAREFEGKDKINILFDFPLWIPDEHNITRGAAPEGSKEAVLIKGRKGADMETRMELLRQAYDARHQFNEGGIVRVDDLCNYLGKNDKTVYRWLKESEGEFFLERGEVRHNEPAQAKMNFEAMEEK